MHYLLYILGVFLLVLPAGLLTRRRLNLISLRELSERPRNRLGWLHWVNFIDLVRACGGLMLVRQAFVIIDPNAAFETVPLLTVAIAALAGLGLQQVFHSSDEDDLVAPVAYAIGLTFAFLPLQVALLALPLGMAAALGLHSVGSGFALAAAAVAGLGLMLQLAPIVTATASIVLFAPVLIAGVLQRRLVLTVRRGPLNRPAPLRDFPVNRSTR